MNSTKTGCIQTIVSINIVYILAVALLNIIDKALFKVDFKGFMNSSFTMTLCMSMFMICGIVFSDKGE